MGKDVRQALIERVQAALALVQDPEVHRPLTELRMVDSIEVLDRNQKNADQSVNLVIRIKLTTVRCPMRERIEADIQQALLPLEEVGSVRIEFGVMSPEELDELKKMLRGGKQKVNPFAQPSSLTRVIGVASGKGGVGKSSITTNLAITAAKKGFSVGILDADIYGHSIPRLMGIIDQRPTTIDNTFFVPVENFGVKVVSLEMFKPDRADHVAYRGPLLHKVLDQLMCDAYWGALDFLFLDLPPGTGDIAISLGQLVPSSEILVVTTPQIAAAEVAERAGRIAHQMNQRILGVVENMSASPCPHCGEQIALFGSGGGEETARRLSALVVSALVEPGGGNSKTADARRADEIKLLAKIPFDLRLQNGGDQGFPAVLEEGSTTTTTAAFDELFSKLVTRRRSIVGQQLG